MRSAGPHDDKGRPIPGSPCLEEEERRYSRSRRFLFVIAEEFL